MFKYPHPNQIESDEGFSIQVLFGGKMGIIYREATRAIKIVSDAAIKPTGYIIYKNSIREWAPPGSGRLIDEQAANRIVDNIRRAFLSQGHNIRVDEQIKFSDDQLKRIQNID